MRNETCFTKPESALNNDMADICKLAIYPLEYTSHTCAQISIQANQRKCFHNYVLRTVDGLSGTLIICNTFIIMH